MSSNAFKCGNCAQVQESKIFSNHDYNQRQNCGVCGKLCKDCHSKSLWSYGKCSGCGKDTKTERFINGKWK